MKKTKISLLKGRIKDDRKVFDCIKARCINPTVLRLRMYLLENSQFPLVYAGSSMAVEHHVFFRSFII
jgi:hypothetical protein